MFGISNETVRKDLDKRHEYTLMCATRFALAIGAAGGLRADGFKQTRMLYLG